LNKRGKKEGKIAILCIDAAYFIWQFVRDKKINSYKFYKVVNNRNRVQFIFSDLTH